jgi:hypothetical protein
MNALRLHDLPELCVDQRDADENDKGHRFHCCSFLWFMVISKIASDLKECIRRAPGCKLLAGEVGDEAIMNTRVEDDGLIEVERRVLPSTIYLLLDLCLDLRSVTRPAIAPAIWCFGRLPSARGRTATRAAIPRYTPRHEPAAGPASPSRFAAG